MRLPKVSQLVLIAFLVVISFVIGRSFAPKGERVMNVEAQTAVEPVEPSVWTCSMHPQVRLPEAGKCPICFMDLIPSNTGDAEENLGPRSLRLSETARALAEIETAKVEYRAVAHEVHMVGKVAFDETRVAYITSWVSGRLDRLFVDYTGVSVRGGDHLVEIYSPTLYSAQQELLQAIAMAKRLESSSLDIVRTTSDQTVHSSREKLRLYGLTDEQVQEVIESGVPKELITILAPIGGVVVHKNALEGMYVEEGTRIYTIADLSKVWVQLDAYESDLAWIRYGQDVEFRMEAYPGETFHGRVAFIDPTLDDRTRTVKVRLNVDNMDQRLKPDMFVSATAQAVLTEHGKVVDEDLAGKWMCPMHPEIVADEASACPECGMDLAPASELGFTELSEEGMSLVIPHTAPLITGRRAVVYVRLPDHEDPTYEGREIALGPRAGDWYVVYDGLEEGEDIVVKGNFKLDSELQIRAKPSMMSALSEGSDDESTEMASVSTPVEFREQMGLVVAAYLDLQKDLADDKDNPAAANSIAGALAGVDMSLLKGEAHKSWMDVQMDITMAAKALAAADEIEQRRVLLSPLTNVLVSAMKTFGYESPAGDAGVFHCPMALDGDGADWIQMGDETSNPYYGDSMLRCGSRTEFISGEN
ncbi:MAG: Cu(I)/Ag(I) efflux system membrane fusion protein [Planctomycetota bacterium]|jgi:Cu(I)/Ag(I) efflux system membrane fusion protein